MLADVFIALFLFFAITVLIKRISSRKVVTMDTITGGVSVYFLVGLLWTFIYKVTLGFNSNAFSHITDEKSDCFYCSFATLTTLGPGDITPLSQFIFLPLNRIRKNLLLLHILNKNTSFALSNAFKLHFELFGVRRVRGFVSLYRKSTQWWARTAHKRPPDSKKVAVSVKKKHFFMRVLLKWCA